MEDPFQPHSHDNNPLPPDENTDISIFYNGELATRISLDELKTRFSQDGIPTYLYTTDHGTHGPYHLDGVALGSLIRALLPPEAKWEEVEVVSADGFGNRVFAHELEPAEPEDPILLCYGSNGKPLKRAHGLIRLVVPSETDNALRQIKWVREIRVK